VVGRAEGLFILQVSGDSMTGVGINSGDWVVVRQLFQPPRNGDIVAAEIEGVEVEGTVKTYMKRGRDVWLMAHNPAYLPIPGNQAKIRGKVIALLRRVERRPPRRLPGLPVLRLPLTGAGLGSEVGEIPGSQTRSQRRANEAAIRLWQATVSSCFSS
jgi:Peptidase S24-like